MTQDSEIVTYNWSPQRYIELVENTRFPMLQEYQRVELDYITSKIQSPQDKPSLTLVLAMVGFCLKLQE